MSAQLPEYLRMQTHALPRTDSVITIGDIRITVITPRLLRIEQGAFTDDATLTVICRDFCPCEFTVTEDGPASCISTGELLLRYTPGLPLDTLTISNLTQPTFMWRFGQKPLQNLKGTTSTLDCVNGACELQDGLCAVDGYAFIDDSKTPRMTPDGWFAGRETCTDIYFFGYGHDYTAAVQDYYRLTGAPGMLPAYALGNWWSRYHAYTDTEYLTLMDNFRQHDIPLSVGIVDMDWHLTNSDGRNYWTDGWTGYTWNEKLFPDYRAFLQSLHQRGLKTALNLHPAQGVRWWDKQYEQMCAALGRDPADQKPIRFNCLHPEFLKAYFEILHFPYESDGIDFWWMDWQQGSDYPAIAGDDYRKTEIEAISPLWMLNHMHYLASQRNGGRGMIFSRYSGYGSQRYPIGFSGDTFITWDSLRFQPYFTATASNVGYGWWSHDIGGHMGGIRDDELTVRWIQLGVFSPIFRLHSTDSVFLGREPWNYNKRAELIISDFMRLRHRLFPYLYTMNRRSSHDLLPLVRPMYHTHPECAEAYQQPNEYWFGSELIAAPITSPSDRSADLGCTGVWLPEGVWTDAMTGYIYNGNQQLDVYRPQEQMPLFLKAGAIVPLQAHQSQSNLLGGSKAMRVIVAPGASNTFRLYEDDGETLFYREGTYAETPMALEWTENAASFTICPVEGDASLVPPERGWTVEFRGWHRDCHFTVNGMPADAVYDAENNTWIVTVSNLPAGMSAMICAHSESGLIHDNGDCRQRCLNRLIRAQLPEHIKRRLLDKLDANLRRTPDDHSYLDMGQDEAPYLGGYMRELYQQLPR